MAANPFFNLPRIEIGDDFFRQITVTETVLEIIDRRLSDFREPLQGALQYILVPSVEYNFADGGRPKWAPLAPATVKSRKAIGPILYRTGTLYEAATDPNNWTVATDFVGLFDLDMVVSYAAYHQIGTRKMPARPYVEYQPEDIEAIMSLFEAWIEHVIDEEWGVGEEGPE